MERHVKLALLAVALPPTNSGEPVVVAVGSRFLTGWVGEEWLAAILPAVDVDRLVKALSEEPSDKLNQLFALQWSPLAAQWFNEGLVGLSDGTGGSTIARWHDGGKSLWIDGIDRVHFFSAGLAGKENIEEVLAPLVALDCAGTAVYGDTSETGPSEPSPTWARSRLKLTLSQELWPAPAVPDAWKQRKTPVSIASFELVAHVPMPAGAHGGGGAPGKRFDPRVLLFARADRAQQTSFWFAAPQGGVSVERLSARFGSLKLALTDKDDLTSSGDATHLHVMASMDKAWLRSSKVVGGGVPLLAGLDIYRTTAPDIRVRARRAGFRQSGDGTRLYLRCELGCRATSWKKLWGATYGDIAQDQRPVPALLDADDEELCWIGFEQQSAEHALKFAPSEASDWSVLFRFDAHSDATNGLVEHILPLFQDFAGKPNDVSLRRFRPETSMRILLDLKPKGNSSKLPWQAVGSYTAPRAKRVLWHAPSWPKLAERVGDLRLQSFQPASSRHWWTEEKWEASVSADPMRARTVANETVPFDSDDAQVRHPFFGAKMEPGDGLQPQNPSRLAESQTGIFFDVAGMKLEGQPRIAIGSLELGLGLTPSDAIGYEVARIVHDRPAGYSAEIRNEVAMHLPATAVSPIAQDPLPAFARDMGVAESTRESEPLLLPLGPADPLKLKLIATESFGERIDQKVEWKLRVADRDDAALQSAALMVIDPRPLRIAAVDGVRIEADATSDLIASFKAGDDGQSSWRFRNKAQKSRLLLPPQIIGEAMEKRVKRPDLEDDIAEGETAEARFGSLTRVDLDATYRDTETQEPAWNLRRILNRVADAAPGALLRELRVELAYGLIARHAPRTETWIAEIGGIVGLPPPLPSGGTGGGAASALGLRRSALLRLQASRIAIDKVWKGRPEARFETSDDLTFTLRLREPDGDAGFNGPETAFRYPVAQPMAENWPALADATSPGPADPLIETFTEDKSGFTGGVPWAFESANILDEVYRTPVSSEGRLSDLYLSALGGWGQQRAAFAGGKSIIETETTQGRMGYYKLERLGRIGALHNRAKHVIIYRRSVAPAAQFYNIEWKKQDPHAGRPILRKVEEYVEILEPERAYPEDSSALVEAGCLVGSRFVTKKMLVDSDWGRDVRREGWMVPLWRNDLAAPKPTDPKLLNEDSPAALFPKPLVQLMMLGEDGKPVAVEIDSPEKLVFYTSSIKSETAELIDQWHAVEGIDFCDAPPPVARETSSPTSKDLHDAMLGPAPRNAGGHDPLTLALVDAKVPIQIAARRVEDGPAIVPKNISLSRARPTTGDGSPPTNNARNVGLASAQLEADLRGRLDRLFGRIPAAFAGLAREIASGKKAALAAIDRSEAELVDELNQIAKAAGDAIKGLEKSIPSPGEIAKGAERTVDDVFGRIESERGRINARVAAALKQGRLLYANEVRRRSAELKAQLEKVAGTLEVVAVGDAVEKPRDDLAAANAAMKNSLGELTAETKQEIKEAFGQIHVNLEALKRACDLTGPIADLKVRTRDAFDVLDVQLKTIGDEAKAWRFNSEEAVRAAQAQAKARFGALRQSQRAARQQLEKLALAARIPEALKDAATAAIGLIDRTGAALNTIEQEIDAAVAVADDAAFKLQLETEVAALAQNVATARDTVLAVIDASASGVEDLKAFLKARVEVLNGTSAVWETKCGEVLDEAYKASLDALKIVEGEAKALLAAVDGSFVTQEIKDAAGRAAAKIRAELLPALDTLTAQPERALDKLDDALKDASDAWQAIVAKARQETLTLLLATFTPALDAADGFAARIKAQIEGVADTGQPKVGAIEQQIHRFADEARRAVEAVGDEVDALRTRLEDMAAKEARRIGDRLGAALGEAQSELARMVGKPPSDLLKDGTTLYQEGDNLMRAIRMVGEGPSANGLGLNRPEVAYVLDALKPLVDMTPAVALANRVASQAAAAGQAAQAAVKLMEALGLRLPVSAIGKDLVPDVLTGLSLSRMCPEFAGLDLDGLLTRAGFPDLSGKDSQGVKVTRGFDKERREAWLKADIDVKLDKPASLLEFGPVAIMLDQGQFRAQTRISIDASGHVEKEAKGMLAGDWRVVTCGMDVVTFEKTPLVFDKTGKLDFQIANDRVRLAPTLEFLTTLMSKLKQSVPTGVEIVMRGGVPAGLMAKIAIDIPPVATGVFAITDLNVAASFGIVAYPTFEIVAGLDVGSRDAPFTLAVWILNGGGYINQRLSYQPLTRPRPILDYTLDVAIVAGVGLGFGFGVVSGAVWLQVGCSVAMKWTTGPGGNVTTVTAFLLARGNVDVAGLVTAGIMLRLEISYDGAEMRARGTLRLSFRISCFYTLRVAQGVEYKLLGEKRSEAPADDYADSFQ